MPKAISIQPMTIRIPDEQVEDLHRRLRHIRWPSPIAGSNWHDGTDGDYLKDLAAYWLLQYNWRDREALLNRFDHYLANIDGTQLHYIHARGEGPNPIPLLMMSGWPSSFIQFLKIIPLLTAQQQGKPCFDVVAVSLQGYPLTSFPTEHGMSFTRIADLTTTLMTEGLGYQRFAARGSDQGAIVQQQMGLKYPDKLIGIHRSGMSAFLLDIPNDLSPIEQAYQQRLKKSAATETMYAQLQAVRPETLTPALADSPIGLASWFIEKFQRWGNGGTAIDKYFGRDNLLDNISLHWFTGAGAASIRLYREAFRDRGVMGRVEVPSAIMISLSDGVTVPAPREWAERFYNVQRWTEVENVGHFPEWEAPEIVANDIRDFFTFH